MEEMSKNKLIFYNLFEISFSSGAWSSKSGFDSKCFGIKNLFAIIVGITALAITTPTINEYCS